MTSRPARAVAVYAGSFDPVTLGHLDLVERAAKLFDEVVVAIGVHPTRRPLFTFEERLSLLEEVVRVVKVTVFVASAPGFTGQPAVANGASNLLLEAFGDIGAHARSAVGVAVLPLDAPVEVELIVELAE